MAIGDEIVAELDKAHTEVMRWKEAYRLLSTETVYDGNSTYHWWAKAHAYSGIVKAVCDAFRKLGYMGEFGDLPTLPDRLNQFVQQLTIGSRGVDELTQVRDRLLALQGAVEKFLYDIQMLPPWESAGALWADKTMRLVEALKASKRLEGESDA